MFFYKFEYIFSYQNDCNTCTCSTQRGLEACTKIECDPNNPIENYCKSCIDGYKLQNETKKCALPGSSYCGENCVMYVYSHIHFLLLTMFDFPIS